MKNIFKKSFVVMFVLSFVFGGVLSSVKKVEAVGIMSIANCTDLQNMTNNLSGSYVLSNNIDCSLTNPVNQGPGYTGMWADGAGFVPIGELTNGNYFTGTFNGNGRKITGLYINRPN